MCTDVHIAMMDKGMRLVVLQLSLSSYEAQGCCRHRIYRGGWLNASPLQCKGHLDPDLLDDSAAHESSFSRASDSWLSHH